MLVRTYTEWRYLVNLEHCQRLCLVQPRHLCFTLCLTLTELPQDCTKEWGWIMCSLFSSGRLIQMLPTEKLKRDQVKVRDYIVLLVDCYWISSQRCSRWGLGKTYSHTDLCNHILTSVIESWAPLKQFLSLVFHQLPGPVLFPTPWYNRPHERGNSMAFMPIVWTYLAVTFINPKLRCQCLPVH